MDALWVQPQLSVKRKTPAVMFSLLLNLNVMIQSGTKGRPCELSVLLQNSYTHCVALPIQA